MTDASSQTVSALTSADEQSLSRQRQLVEKYVADESLENFRTPAGKLGTIRAILDANVFAATQTYELQSLGIVFGDALASHLGLEWIMVSDSYGRDPALRAPGTRIILFPLTTISKRIEKGDAVDVFELFNAAVATVERSRSEGR